MLSRAAALVALLLAAAAARAAPAQALRVTLRTPGPERHAALVRRALDASPTIVLAPDTGLVLRRDTTLAGPLLVLDGDAMVAARVEGSIHVVNGDLFLRPGAVVDGDVTVIGGCAYRSALALVRGEQTCVRDATYAVTPLDGTLALDWIPLDAVDTRVVTLPLLYGFRIPEYTRVDGLVVPWGPRLVFDTGRIELDPTVTYRSDLGELDPAVAARARLGARLALEAEAGRGTFSNDRWIRSNPINSIGTLVSGRDTRNYWRADRIEGRLAYETGTDGPQVELWAGARTERAWSVAAGGPWSAFSRGDTVEGIPRPNPGVARGRITSALAGGTVRGALQDVDWSAAATVERALDAPGDARFTQVTGDASIGFPTFGTQRLSFETHLVATAGDEPPPQRFAYLGGSGTLPTLDLLGMGGDRLFYLEGRYIVTLERWRLPLVGPPTVTLRWMAGSAGVGSLPDFAQNLALRVAVTPVRVELALDPETGDTELRFGVSMGR